MNKKELLNKLQEQADNRDYEEAHHIADRLLLEYIDDEDIAEAFLNVGRWYA